MRLTALSLTGFRNHASTSLELDGASLHVLLGENGSGKTNVLEAVGLLSLLKSPRAMAEDDVLQWGGEFFRIAATAETDGGESLKLELVSEHQPRRRKGCFVNDVRVGVAAMVGQLPTVTFFPEDLGLFSGPPAGRRRFLDQILCQVSPEYLRDLVEYQRLLKQRNALLRRIAAGQGNEAELTPWDEALARTGSAVTVARLGLLETLNLSLPQEMTSLGFPGQPVILANRSEIAGDLEAVERALHTALREQRPRDVILQTTSAGPHRDDWDLTVAGRSLGTFASRGQQRVALVALLFLQVSYLHLRRGEKPVVLLDDVFSELDLAHQTLLLQALTGYQVLTSTAHPLPDMREACVWEVSAGSVCRSRSPAVHA